MTTLKELFNQDTNTATKRFGVVSIGLDIFKEEEMTPHKEMSKSLELFETRPLINSGIKQLARFILGGDIKVVGPDDKSNEYVKKWMDKRHLLKSEVENGIISGLLTGNVYTEEVWADVNGSRFFDNIATFPDSSVVFINMWDPKPDEYYFVQIPVTVSTYDGHRTKFRQISYFYYDRVWKQSVWCVSYPKSKFHHLKIGFSRNNIYGRSYISSVIDNATVLKEILKNIAIISRYRALNSKIIMPAGEQEDILEDDIENNKQKFFEARDGSHIFLNKPMKIDSFSNTNEYDTMSNEMEFLRKEISSGLVPNFITPFNSEVNRATAQEAKIPFVLEIEYLQSFFENYYTKIIVGNLRKSFPKLNLHPDTELKFENVDMETKADKAQYYTSLYSTGIVTFNEVRKALGLEPVKGGDTYSWQTKVPEDSSMTALNTIQNDKEPKTKKVVRGSSSKE